MADKTAPITNDTRWTDAKGRQWKVIGKLYFGRYECVLANRPSLSGVWTAKEIRAAIAYEQGGTA